MGIRATWCAVCGAPVNHDHYSGPDDREFSFGPEHAWLCRVVGVNGRTAVHGTVEDTELTYGTGKKTKTVFVGSGLGEQDFDTMHEVCWELAKQPKSTKKLPTSEADPAKPDRDGATRTDAWADIRPYMLQLFDFHALAADGNGWMIVDPASPAGERNRKRIEGILRFVPIITNGVDPAAVQRQREAIATGAWRTARTDVVAGAVRAEPAALPRALYPLRLTIAKPYPALDSGLPKPVYDSFLDDFTATLRSRFEPDVGIVASAIKAGGRCTYLIYLRGREAADARLDQLGELHMPQPSTLEFAADPAWTALDEASAALPG